MIRILENKKYCTGCSACANKCQVQAISMEENEEGFLYPTIDEKKCIHCNACASICPALTNKSTNNSIAVFAAKSKNEKERLRSSSGGIFYEIGKFFIQELQAFVYGATYEENWKVVHKKVDTIDKLNKLQGSKYVQSNMGECYIEIKRELLKKKKIVFAGTPCQVDGLIHFLGEKPSNLFTVDFVCHGVGSPKIWDCYIEELKRHFHAEIISINQRSKKKRGWRNFSTEIHFGDGQIYENLKNKDEYMCLFLNDYILRESCYHCQYKNFNRCSDLTLGDFWGIESIKSGFKDDMGTSLLLINTEQGKKYWEQINRNCDFELHQQKECMQAALNIHASIPKQRKKFWNLFWKKGYQTAAQKYGRQSLLAKIIQKKCIPIIRKLGIYEIVLSLYHKVKVVKKHEA